MQRRDVQRQIPSRVPLARELWPAAQQPQLRLLSSGAGGKGGVPVERGGRRGRKGGRSEVARAEQAAGSRQRAAGSAAEWGGGVSLPLW